MIVGSIILALLALTSIAIPPLLNFTALSPLLCAMLLGMILGNLGFLGQHIRDGIQTATKPLLQAGIVLLGMQITISHLLEFGLAAIAITLVTVASTFAFTIAFGRLLGVDSRMAQLVGAGTSICGASAIVAANSVAGASREDVAYALASITFFGTLAMLIYPSLAQLAGLGDFSYGLWTGLSIHEVGQVVVAGFQVSDAAGEFATTAKLGRVVLLAPMIILLGIMSARQDRARRGVRGLTVPWFVVGFIVVILFNSTVAVPTDALWGIKLLTTFLFAMALCGIGIEADLTKIRGRSTKPLQLTGAATLFISAISFILIATFGG